METLLQALGIGLKKQGRWFIKDFHIELHAGEKLAIIGGMGTGKTTLANMMAGLQKPDVGDMRRKGSVAYVPQEFQLYKDLTVQENIEFTCAVNGFSTKAAGELLAEAGLRGREQVRAERLPTGLQKMLQYVGARCREFSVLIIDEPFTGMDDAGRARVEQMINAEMAKGKGIVVLTRLEAETEKCDRFYQLTEPGEDEEPAWRSMLYPEPDGVRE